MIPPDCATIDCGGRAGNQVTSNEPHPHRKVEDIFGEHKQITATLPFAKECCHRLRRCLGRLSDSIFGIEGLCFAIDSLLAPRRAQAESRSSGSA
jgi:hypothetical protein